MPAQTVRSDFDQLSNIASAFGKQSENVNRSQKAVMSVMQTLQDGDWIGDSANRFYSEMEQVVLPAFGRLVMALEQAQTTTTAIRDAMRQAEQDVCGVMKDKADGTAAPGGAGASGGSGASGPQVGFKPKTSVSIKSGEFNSLKLQLFDGSLYKDEFLGGKITLGGGAAGLGVKQTDKGTIIGAYADAYAAKQEWGGALAGDKDLGWTAGGEVKALSATGFAGYREGSFGADVGVNLVSAKGETGVNVAGYNVGVSGEIGLKLELGVQIGKNTKIKLGPITIGFSFGGAKD